MSADTKSKQWFIKVIFAGQVLRVDTVWADTESMATLIAHKKAVSEIETQRETKEETHERLLRREYNQLRFDNDQLEEFLYDDYGDTVAQMGMEKVRELEQKFKNQQQRLRELSELLK